MLWVARWFLPVWLRDAYGGHFAAMEGMVSTRIRRRIRAECHTVWHSPGDFLAVFSGVGGGAKGSVVSPQLSAVSL